MTSDKSQYDVAIIGAGMSGLAAGIRLAYYNQRVVVLDKHTMPGGLNSFYTLGGRKFDVGLHAMTNYVSKDVRSAPLNKLLRQLRLRHEDFALCPQLESDVRFPGVTLRFNNDFRLLETEVAGKFPKQADNFQRLVKHIREYNDVDLYAKPLSAREVVRGFLTDSLLEDMLFCPLMYYGSANVDDMEFGQFVIMFKSIFCEGFARPRIGVRQIVSTLLKKYKECGGELRMGVGVSRLQIDNDRVASLELDNGETIRAARVLTSAGLVETMRLCSDARPGAKSQLDAAGQMTFCESIYVLNKQPAGLGYKTTITFFNNWNRFDYRPATEALDVRSGVICCPNNFQYETPLDEGMIRVTNIARFDAWAGLPEEQYQAQKKAWAERSVAEVLKFVPDFRPFVQFVDSFTPRTIHKFTSHLNGAVYGAPGKLKDGRTRLSNLFVIGTDQGFLGIVGAMLSGISMANLHVLQGKSDVNHRDTETQGGK